MNRTQVHIFDYFTLKLREPNIKICKYSEEKNIMKNNYKKITLDNLVMFKLLPPLSIGFD